jgi:hypothetical protein
MDVVWCNTRAAPNWLISQRDARGGLISLKNGLINGRRVAVGEINLRAPRAAIMQIRGERERALKKSESGWAGWG